jgi:methylated-DNA-protein-cysteine methyltransferase-like protein
MCNSNFEQKVYTLLAAIPVGRVTTYGQIAQSLHCPNNARHVGRILSRLPKNTSLPWHRVVNANGKISLAPTSNGYQIQKARLEREGIVVNNNRVRLHKYIWHQ